MLFHGYYQLNDDPLVVSTWDDAALQHICRLQPKRPAYCLVHIPWHHGVFHRMLRKKFLFYTLRSKGIRPLLITNSKQEESHRKRLGVPGIQCISYIYTPEQDYSVQTGVEKKYDAIYAAQLQTFKRIELAAAIDKLFVLTYTPGQKQNDLPAFCPAVKHAGYNRRWVGPAEKNLLYNQSSVGLCLSREEGPMLASLEYQLAGLPVVSTASTGGRDEYYHPDTCIVVADNPKAVQAGVQEMIRQRPDPDSIRKRTLQRLMNDRSRYADFITTYIQQHSGILIDPHQLFTRLFTHSPDTFVRTNSL